MPAITVEHLRMLYPKKLKQPKQAKKVPASDEYVQQTDLDAECCLRKHCFDLEPHRWEFRGWPVDPDSDWHNDLCKPYLSNLYDVWCLNSIHRGRFKFVIFPSRAVDPYLYTITESKWNLIKTAQEMVPIKWTPTEEFPLEHNLYMVYYLKYPNVVRYVYTSEQYPPETGKINRVRLNDHLKSLWTEAHTSGANTFELVRIQKPGN